MSEYPPLGSGFTHEDVEYSVEAHVEGGRFVVVTGDDKPKVAIVDGGKVTALKAGSSVQDGIDKLLAT